MKYTFASYPEALGELVGKLRAREFDPDEYHVVLTPDRYTQSVERALFSNGGAIDLEVLTLSRLSRRVAPSDKVLSREGGVMLAARAIAAVESELTYYKRAAKYTDFARNVYDTMQQLCASGADVENITASNAATRSKLRDLALIRAEYVKQKGEYSDSPDRLTALARAIPTSEFVKNAHFYAIGYSLGYNTTKLNNAVFAALAGHAKSFDYYEATPPESVRERLVLLSAPDRATQYKHVAVRICEYMRQGGHFGDVSVVCPEPRALARILREYGIEYYHDESTPLYNTAVVAAIENIYKLHSSIAEGKPLDGEALVSLCKNPYSGVDDVDAQALQNRMISRGRFVSADADYSDDGANRAAARAAELAEKFVGGFAEAVRSVIEFGEFEEVQKRVFEGCTDALGPVLSLVELLDRYGAKHADTDARSFFAAARAVEIKSVPRYKDRVIVTMPDALRLEKCKLLFVTDFNEGVLPVAVADKGLLGDDEIIEINGTCRGVEIDPTVREQNRRERAELAAVVRNAERVFCTFVTAGKRNHAAFVTELAKNIDRLSHAELASTLKRTDEPSAIARYACVTSAAREMAARRLTSHSESIVAAVGQCKRTSPPFENTVRNGGKQTVSVSELANYFRCPYKRFLHDAVGLADRRKSAFDAPDFGTVMHEFMKKFIDDGNATGNYDCSHEYIKSLVDGEIEKKGLFLDGIAYSRLLADAEEFARLNVEILKCGNYTPYRTEYKFTGKTLGNSGVEFTGKIDRIDSVSRGDGVYYRIVDYKTGSTEFGMKKCYDGTDMQLPLYAYALDADRVTGFFYVKLAQRYESKRPTSGRLVADIDVARDYDMSIDSGEASAFYSMKIGYNKKEKRLKFNGTYKAQLERAEFDALIDRCVSTAGTATDEMYGGYIERTPIAGECERCAYFGVCGEHKVPRGDDGEEQA